MMNIEPWLAESYTVSDDAMVYTFKLREGVLFHNGAELTADDVIYTIDRAMVSPMVAPGIAPYDHCVKLDDYNLELHLKHPYPLVIETLAATTMGIVNKALYEEYGEGAQEAVVGTGPYKLVEWTSDGNNVYLEYFEDHWADEPQIKQVQFRTITDLNAAAIAFESGELDLVTAITPTDSERLAAGGEYSSCEFYRQARWGISINNQDPVFSDLRIRQAMNHALDKDEVNSIAGEGVNDTKGILVKTSALNEGHQKALDENRLTIYEYDLEKAQALMKEAGYDEDNRLSTTMLCNQSSTAQAFSAAVQAQLAKIYMDVEIEVMETGTWLNRLGTRDFSISWAEWGPQYYWSPMIYYFYYHDGLFYNYENINNPLVNEMTELGMMEMDKAKREEYAANLLEEITAQAICVPVWQCRFYAISTKGLKVYPDDVNRFCKAYWMEWTDEEPFQYDAVWIPNEMQR